MKSTKNRSFYQNWNLKMKNNPDTIPNSHMYKALRDSQGFLLFMGIISKSEQVSCLWGSGIRFHMFCPSGLS